MHGKRRIYREPGILKLGPFEIKFGKADSEPTSLPAVGVDQLEAWSGQTGFSGFEDSIFDGGKFPGGFGTTQVQFTDYWTLRQRSIQLFTENLYAKGLIRRLLTNELNRGLFPEAAPDETLLGLEEDSLSDWSEDVENRFGLWARNELVCDWRGEQTWAALQKEIRREALIAGDVLVLLRPHPKTGIPRVQIITGNQIQTPLGTHVATPSTNTIDHGVERNADGRVVAYWVRQKDFKFKRLPAYGSKTGRRIAWLVFGADKRYDEVRGQPLLAVVLQSLKELDRYRDASLRKAVLNSILAMFVKKNSDKPGTLPLTGGAVKKGTATEKTASGDRSWNFAEQLPGMVIEELQEGEEPVAFSTKDANADYGAFEQAVVQAIAWSSEVPPEILTLAFSNNYSASQAAINEFKIYLEKMWHEFGEAVCTPVYNAWLIEEVRRGEIKAPGLLEAWRDTADYVTLGAWVSVDWYGSIKPSTDMLKQAKGSEMLISNGFSTRAREARITTGTKFSKNIKRVKRENEQLAEANAPLLPPPPKAEIAKPKKDNALAT